MPNCMCYRNFKNQRGNVIMRTMRSGRSMAMRPIMGSGAVLLGTPPTAQPPFYGTEQLSSEVLYSKGSGVKSEMDKLSSKLDKLNLVKPSKTVRKNIKISF